MAAQRKLIDPAAAHRPAEPAADTEGWAPRPTVGSPSQSSPAHLLLLELSARLQQPAAVGVPAVVSGEPKWPMPVRLATIGVLSVASWALFILGIAAIV